MMEVEQALLGLEWSLRTQGAMAKRHEVSVATIRRDAAKIRRGWTESEEEREKDGKADWIARLRAATVQARREGHPVATQRLMALEAQAQGYLEPLRAEIELTHRAEALSPVEQARAIVGAYDHARRYLETTGEIPALLDVTPKEIT